MHQFSLTYGMSRSAMVKPKLLICAATIAYLHATGGGATSFVTASIDRVDLLKYPLSAETDLLMSGMVVRRSARVA
jgi:hypothetical protein